MPRWALDLVTSVFIRDRREGTDTQRRPGERGRDCREAVEAQECLQPPEWWWWWWEVRKDLLSEEAARTFMHGVRGGRGSRKRNVIRHSHFKKHCSFS